MISVLVGVLFYLLVFFLGFFSFKYLCINYNNKEFKSVVQEGIQCAFNFEFKLVGLI